MNPWCERLPKEAERSNTSRKREGDRKLRRKGPCVGGLAALCIEVEGYYGSEWAAASILHSQSGVTRVW